MIQLRVGMVEPFGPKPAQLGPLSTPNCNIHYNKSLKKTFDIIQVQEISYKYKRTDVVVLI